MQGNRTRTMERHLLLLRLTVVIVVLTSTWMMPSAVAAVERRPTPKLVWINKCCPYGEQLEKSRVCVNGPPRGWVPLVFLSRRNKHFEPQGEAPNFFRVNANTRPKSCQNPEMYVGLDRFAIFSNGSLFLSEKSAVISAEDYCVDREASLVCFPEIHGMDSLIAPKKLSRVRKCCGRDMAYDEVNRTCVFLTEPSHPLRRTSIVNSSNVEIIYGFPECNNRTDYAIAGRFRYELLNIETGNLILDSGKRFKSDDFCLEHSINNDYDPNSKSAYVNMFACSEHFSEPEVISVTRDDLRFLLYPIGLFISVIFLLATLAAGFLIPSNHHVLHWRCQTYYVACLLVGDLLLASTQLSGTALEGTACILMAIFMHFFFLAAFFWLNTMCFNIWWTFRDFRPTSLEKGQELFRLRIYRIYAWGVPLIISSIAAIFDLIPRSPDDKFLRPRFDEARCWFYGDMEIFAYFFGPIAILLCINILLFASTTRQLTCGLWKRDDVKSTTERAALGRVCLKLVIVMGVTWVADIISWLVGGPQYVWYLTDLINALQGVFIFIVVGCQPQVWSAIKRIWSSKTGRGVTNTTNGPQHSSSSHGLPSIGESVTHNTLTNTTSTKVPMETVC